MSDAARLMQYDAPKKPLAAAYLGACQPIGRSVSCESFRSSCSTIFPSATFGSALRPKHVPTPTASVLDLEANLIESTASRRSNA